MDPPLPYLHRDFADALSLLRETAAVSHVVELERELAALRALLAEAEAEAEARVQHGTTGRRHGLVERAL